MNVVAHNLSSMFTNRELGVVTDRKTKSTEKLSSGYKINRAADDAAGLSISEKMRRQIRGLKQGSDNMEDGVSLCQTADGYLEEVIAMLHRMNELSIKAANGTNSASDRMDIDNEIQELKEETNRIFRTARFNEVRIFEMPYVPASYVDNSYESEKDIHDIQVFSSGLDSSNNIIYGGIELNNIRHTWDELKAESPDLEISADGKTFVKDAVISFKDSNNELIELHVKGGDPVSNVSRRNYWSAKSDGIYVNDVLAATWDQIKSSEGRQDGIQDDANFGEYEFRYRNQVISFQVNDGDNKQAVIDGINGVGLNTKYSWDTFIDSANEDDKSSYSDKETKALSRLTGNTINVNDTNKDYLDKKISIDTTENNITVNIEGVGDLRTMSWGNQAQELKSGNYPIADWGLNDVDGNGVKSQTVTFDDSVTYVYDNTDTAYGMAGLKLSFNLADEAGYDQVEKAIDGLELGKTFYAPSTMQGSITTSGNGGTPTFKFTYSGTSDQQLSYETQKAYGRTFNNQYDQMTGSISRKLHSGSSSQTIKHFGYSDDDPVPAGTTDGGTVYVKQGEYYVKADKTINHETVTSYRTESVTDTYSKAHYSYSGSFNGKTLDNQDGGTFEYSIRTTSRQSYIEKRSVASYTYQGDPLTSDQVDAIPGAIKEDTPDTSEHITVLQDWTTDHSTDTVEIKSNADDTIPINLSAFGSNGKLGVINVKDLNSYSTISPLGDATINLNFKATDYATVTFKANERSDGNVNDPIRLRGVKINIPPKEIPIQVSAKNPDHINLQWSGLNNGIIGIKGTNTKTIQDARYAIDEIAGAIKMVSDTRSVFGAQQNRLEHSIKLNDNTAENTQHAESVIRDTDMAAEMVRFSKESILQQAGQAMLTQASKEPERILQLLS